MPDPDACTDLDEALDMQADDHTIKWSNLDLSREDWDIVTYRFGNILVTSKITDIVITSSSGSEKWLWKILAHLDNIDGTQHVRRMTITDCGLSNRDRAVIRDVLKDRNIVLVLDPVPTELPSAPTPAATMSQLLDIWFSKHDPTQALPASEVDKIRNLSMALNKVVALQTSA